jgi:hypothetical protein
MVKLLNTIGVLEYWSVGVLDEKNSFIPLAGSFCF